MAVVKRGSHVMAVKLEKTLKEIRYNRMTVERLAARSYVYINLRIGTFLRGVR